MRTDSRVGIGGYARICRRALLTGRDASASAARTLSAGGGLGRCGRRQDYEECGKGPKLLHSSFSSVVCEAYMPDGLKSAFMSGAWKDASCCHLVVLVDVHSRDKFTKFYNVHHVHHVHPHLCFQQLTRISTMCNVHPNVHHVHLSEAIKRLAHTSPTPC